MRHFIIAASLCLLASRGHAQLPIKFPDTMLLQPVELLAIRASDKSPVAKTNLSKKEIEKNNIGQDLPYILNQTASVIVNSDAGNGIGYTGIRIRGSDASRINVTLNGIPYNDAESQGTFFVDIPDIASSAGSIQVQRGVGTSTNGSGSFGGSINLNTNDLVTKKALQFNTVAGSYHSFKNTLRINSGLLGKHFSFDGRISDIRSAGYIQRASTKLTSYYGSVAFTGTKNSLRLNIFSGKEKTYQAWNGIDEKTLLTNRRYNSAGTAKAGEPYENETDNYIQTHYQLFYNHKFNDHWKGSAAIFLTTGRGYYEQYRAEESLSDYGLPAYLNGNIIIEQTDLIRRLWLSNKFYGSTFSLHYNRSKTNVIVGGGWNSYDGNHFGEVIKATIQEAIPFNFKWYDLTAYKKDYSAYTKWSQEILKYLQIFVDVQARAVNYTINGFKNNPLIVVENNFSFLNPKAGITYTKNKMMSYVFYGRTSKEPNRDDFEAGQAQQPRVEVLNDFETGLEHKDKNHSLGINIYYMLYKDQLVLTGKINDVGAYTRTNIPKSYRAGIEFQAAWKLNSWVSASGNVTFSENRIKNFTEYIDDYDNGGQQTKFYKNNYLSYSPAIVSSASINIQPKKNFEFTLINKYVSRQFLDNTSSSSRSLNPYFVQDARIAYTKEKKKKMSLNMFIQANNIFSKKYEPNGYTFSYIYGGVSTTENYYFPMAPFNIMAGIGISL